MDKLYVFPDFEILEGFELVNTEPEPPDWDIEKSDTVNPFTPYPFNKSVNTSSLKVKLIFKLFWLIEEVEIWYKELSIVIVKLSDPEYWFPIKSVPDTVAVVDEIEEVGLKVYVHILLLPPIDILRFEPIPVIDIVGVTLIASEKVAVIVTLVWADTILSLSELERLTVGPTLSNWKTVEEAVLVLPAKSLTTPSARDIVTVPE